ncbi:hypothetical protein BKA62DRAFT_676044 [Auriculariales sp. MPI-PUGE-AT-0066]|nr:hypothetical protein BKA62DRAFT_676044 [Auriculariales sp. MPI-PUGE-AT-0066]
MTDLLYCANARVVQTHPQQPAFKFQLGANSYTPSRSPDSIPALQAPTGSQVEHSHEYGAQLNPSQQQQTMFQQAASSHGGHRYSDVSDTGKPSHWAGVHPAQSQPEQWASAQLALPQPSSQSMDPRGHHYPHVASQQQHPPPHADSRGGQYVQPIYDPRSARTPAPMVPVAQSHHQSQWTGEQWPTIPSFAPGYGSQSMEMPDLEHISKHIEESRRTCETCGKVYSRRDVMLRHAAKAHVTSASSGEQTKKTSPKSIDDIVQQMSANMDENSRTCEYCGKMYSRRDGVLRHIANAHPGLAHGHGFSGA